jgi:hypothetical protein
MPEITTDPGRGSIRRGPSRAARRSQRRARTVVRPTYVRPTIRVQPGPITERERRTKIEAPRGRRAVARGRRVARQTRIRRERREGIRRAAPKVQPGPYRARERRQVARAKRRAPYKRAVREAREAGLREARRQYVKRARPPGVFTEREREITRRFEARQGRERLREVNIASDPRYRGLKKGQVRTLGGDVADTKAELGAFRVLTTPYQIARATAEDPKAVTVGTLKGAKETVVNIPASAVRAVQDPEQAVKEFTKDISRRYGPLVRGETKKFRERLKKEGAFAELLETGGAAAVGTRAVVGGTVAGKPVGVAGATRRGRKAIAERRERTAPGTRIVEREAPAKNIVRRAPRRAVERVQARRAQSLYRRADEADREGMVATADDLRKQGAERDPRKIKRKQIRRRYDEREDLAERRRRDHRGQTVGKAKKALDRKHADVQLLLAQKIIRPNRESLKRYHHDLVRESKGDLPEAHKRANRRTIKRLRDALDADKKGKLDWNKLSRKADEYADLVRPLQDELVERGIVHPAQARMAKLIPYAVREMDAKWRPAEQKIQTERPEGTGWKKTSVDFGQRVAWRREGRLERDGRGLKAREIEAHMRENGVDPRTVAFVSQSPKATGPGAFFQAWQRPTGIGSQKRTGEATRKGSFDVDREVGIANAARMQSLRDAHNEYAEFIGEFGYRERGGNVRRFRTRKEAEDFIANQLDAQSPQKGGKLTASAYAWRAIPTRPMFSKRDASDALLDQADELIGYGGASKNSADAIEAALRGEGDGKYVLVLDDAADQMSKHMRLLQPAAASRAIYQAGRLFRGTVLTTAISWPTGNIVEGLVRAGVRGVTPRDVAFARRVEKRLASIDPDMAEEFRHRIGSGNFGIEDMRAIHTTAESYADNATLSQGARLLGALRQTPGPKQVADAWSWYTQRVFGANGWLEHWIKMGMAGKGMRDLRMSDSRLKDYRKAVEQAAEGLRGTNEQVALAKYVRRAYGRYEAFSPSQRYIISTFTPFAAWVYNAAKFLTVVMPLDHPVMSAILAANSKAQEEWRRNKGLNLLPGFMQGGLPTSDEEITRIARYTPFGVIANPTETVAGTLLPQLMGPYMASRGLDWKGDVIGGKERREDVSEGERVREALFSLGGSFIPGVNPVKKIEKEGIRGVVNPFEPTPWQGPEITKAFDELKRIELAKDAIRKRNPNVSADEPTPEYARLHARERELNQLLHKESKGKYGEKYKEPYEHAPAGAAQPSGGGGGGAWWEQGGGGGTVREAAPKAPSGGGQKPWWE